MKIKKWFTDIFTKVFTDCTYDYIQRLNFTIIFISSSLFLAFLKNTLTYVVQILLFPFLFLVPFLVLNSWYASFTIPTKTHSANSDGVIKCIRFSIYFPHVFLDLSNYTATKPSISHDAFCCISFIAAFDFWMTKFLKDAFSDWCKSPSSVATDNGAEVIWYWKPSLRVTDCLWDKGVNC